MFFNSLSGIRFVGWLTTTVVDYTKRFIIYIYILNEITYRLILNSKKSIRFQENNQQRTMVKA